MTQKKIDIVIKDKSNDYHIHFFITRDEAVRGNAGKNVFSRKRKQSAKN